MVLSSHTKLRLPVCWSVVMMEGRGGEGMVLVVRPDRFNSCWEGMSDVDQERLV